MLIITFAIVLKLLLLSILFAIALRFFFRAFKKKNYFGLKKVFLCIKHTAINLLAFSFFVGFFLYIF